MPCPRQATTVHEAPGSDDYQLWFGQGTAQNPWPAAPWLHEPPGARRPLAAATAEGTRVLEHELPHADSDQSPYWLPIAASQDCRC